MKSLTNDLLVVSVVVAVVAVTGYAYYRDLTARVSGNEGKPIGTVIYKRNNAQRRFANNVIWQEAQPNTPVYDLEYIRTVANSAAVVHLEDGTQISLGANTLVQLTWNQKKRQIQFLAGDLTANKESSGHQTSASNQVLIKSQGSSVALQSANVSLSKTKNGLDVSVASGSVKLQNGSSSQVVGSREVARLSNGQKGATVTKQYLFPSAPHADSIEIVHNAMADLTFSWTSDTSVDRYSLELSGSRDFAQTEESVTTQTTSAKVTLKPAIYYWRVSASLAGLGERSSPARKLMVLNDPPIATISPNDGTVYSYRNRKPRIQYIWESSGIASAYRLQIATDRTFTKPIYSKSSTETAVALDTLGPGRYYWRVVPIYNFGTDTGSGGSQTRSFRITRLAALTAPKPTDPADGTIANTVNVSANGLLFNWQPDPDVSTYTVLIASDKSFAEVTKRYQTQDNYVLMRNPPQPGTYYWKLEAKTSDGTSTPPSAVRSLHLRAEKATIKLVMPADGNAYDPSIISNSRFSWTSDIAGHFSIQVGRDPNFANPLSSTRSNADSVAVGSLPPGTYFWRVRLVNESGSAVLSSPVGRFTVLPPLGTSQLLDPVDGANFNLINAAKLSFTWTKVPHATDYQFTLARSGTGGASTELFSRSAIAATQLDITEMSLFKPGTYTWSVTARSAGTANQSDQQGSTAQASFTLGKVANIPAPLLLSPAEGSTLDGLGAFREGVGFSWKGPGPQWTTELTLARVPDLANQIATVKKTTDAHGDASAFIAQLSPGTYYWRVTGRSSDGFQAPDSRTEQFTVGPLPPLAVPQGLEPADRSNVNMWGKQALTLSWSEVPSASYYVVRLLSGSTVLQKWESPDTTRLQFTALDKLAVGSFAWDVTAYETDHAGTVVRKSPPALAHFSISLNKMSAPKITLPGVIYVH